MKRPLLALALALGILVLGAPVWTPPAQATTLTLVFSDAFEMDDKPDPVGAPPWLTANFEDVTGGVNLTLEANVGTQKITNIYFNYSDPDSLPFDWTLPASGVDDVAQDEDAHKADGDGWYDIQIELPTSGDIFTGTDTLEFFIADAMAAYFEEVSNDTAFPYYGAAHVQSLPNGGSTWIYAKVDDGGGGGGGDPIPEPSTFILLGSGLLGLFYAGKKRSRS